MVDLLTTDVFDKWLSRLRDRRARAKILARIRRLSLGNPGDVRPIGQGISELRIDYGPGYRIYYMQPGRDLVILLWAGDKNTQKRDITLAKAYAAQWNEETR